MKIVTVVGARPQFIKASVVSKALDAKGISQVLVHTGQHFDKNMSDVFFNELEMQPPLYNLCIGGGSHGENTGRMIEAIEGVLITEQPDWVLVYGDTDSTLAGTLAAIKLHIPVAHIEAGLRSFNRNMPEELNRILTDHASSLLFAPTTTAIEHLGNEGISASQALNVGDVMYDAALYYGDKAENQSSILDDLEILPQCYILATIHRAENTDIKNRLRTIIESFSLMNKIIVLPLHPRTKEKLISMDIKLSDNIKLVPPLGYLDMVMIEKNAQLIVTDSGGVQKEAFFYQVPCVTLRDETEWGELVDAGWNKIISPNLEPQEIAKETLSAINTIGSDIQPYGDGMAATKIVDILLSRYES